MYNLYYLSEDGNFYVNKPEGFSIQSMAYCYRDIDVALVNKMIPVVVRNIRKVVKSLGGKTRVTERGTNNQMLKVRGIEGFPHFNVWIPKDNRVNNTDLRNLFELQSALNAYTEGIRGVDLIETKIGSIFYV